MYFDPDVMASLPGPLQRFDPIVEAGKVRLTILYTVDWFLSFSCKGFTCDSSQHWTALVGGGVDGVFPTAIIDNATHLRSIPANKQTRIGNYLLPYINRLTLNPLSP